MGVCRYACGCKSVSESVGVGVGKCALEFACVCMCGTVPEHGRPMPSGLHHSGGFLAMCRMEIK